MSSQAQQLLQLQALDAEILRLNRQIEQLTADIGDQLNVKAAAFAMRQAEDALRARQSEQREREFELAQIEARIDDHEKRLYSGKGSPRDLQALQQDIAHDRERRDAAEEQALMAMERTEAARAELERIRQAVDRVLSESSAGKERLAAARVQAQSQLTRRTEERATLAAMIPQPALQLYQRLRERLPDGVAVAEVVQSRCEGCRTTLPSADVQRARLSPAPVQCPTCQRILFVR